MTVIIIGASSDAAAIGVRIYQHGGFGGAVKELPVGRYNSNQLGIGNKQASSVRIPKGYVVFLYEGEGCTGNCVSFAATTCDLNMDIVAIFNDRTSSIEVAPIVAEIQL
ncbi:MAG: hypothetical protein LBJ92_02710 [Holosporales bacterium]|jgi:hypothetical protein|nr:hypothetical protein [Holosporales bacterium]